MVTVRKLDRVSLSMLSLLVDESQREGFRFIRRLLRDYEEGTNRFDQLGECLVGAYASDGQLIAIAGLNTDPYCDATRVGRLRRFYVSRPYRRKGTGTLMLESIIQYAKPNYDVLTLYTDSKKADRFYTSFGFSRLAQHRSTNTSHYLYL
ncbi:acetyltransferase, GNAT family [Geomicrobium sp. JCM 19037]|uniref:GNAT family N-acetyltransferase n=1 Tax=unclassified Geomicrobium TaxID=2628951 RepID=UPI00045F23E3|nr:GNAT family N-acetyltransferase [Geomicrobium sp. JCM 19037]GAK04001.1 acetyltransferase, GNAT family [Geomicrobium sp. JCM 19037]